VTDVKVAIRQHVCTLPEGTANAYVDLKGKDLESNLLGTEEVEGISLPSPKTV
jgi:adenylylsulfate reductase subunit B